MSAQQTPPPVSPVVRVTTVAAVVVVAAVAAVISFSHMQEVAERAGEEWRSWLLPLSVDGLIIAGSMVILVRRRAGVPFDTGASLAWVALLGGVGASLACNIAAAEPNTTARLIAGWPPLAFAAAFELLLQQRRPVNREGITLSAPVPVDPVDHPSPGSSTPSTTPRFRPPMGAPPIGPAAAPVAPFARVGDHIDHRSTTPRPPVDQIPTPPFTTSTAVPSAVAEPETLAQVNGSAALRGTRVAEPSPTGRPPVAHPSPRPPVATVDGSAPGTADDPLVARVAALVDAAPPGRPPGRRTVARELDVTEYQASLLLAQVATPTAPPASNGAATRKESAR